MRVSYYRVGLAVLLILLVATILLWSDRHSRKNQVESPQSSRQFSLALLLHSSSPVVDEAKQGVLDGLAAAGFRDGETLAITSYNPEGDLATANLMAQKIVGSGYDLSISLSTLMLQVLANANQQGHIKHVFGSVTSPVSAGVGIKSLDSLDKPAYLTGIATPQPVADIFKMAKQINPSLKVVGVVWNPAEVNSEICTRMAREISSQLGITLLEAPIEQSKDVREAAVSLVARGAQAFWAGGDLTVNNAIESLITVAQSAHIPVFSNITSHAKRGGLFDLGANYHDVGFEAGRIAGEILSGADSAQIPVRNFVPRRIVVNLQTMTRLPAVWQIDDQIKSQAAEVIDIHGVSQVVASSMTTTAQAPSHHIWKLKRVMYIETPPAEDALRGFNDGFRDAGLVKDRDYQLVENSAQGDMALLPTLIDAANSDGTELLITLSTPTLQTAINKIKKIPLIFTLVSNPFIAGAGTDDNQHKPNVTGVYTLGPYAEMAALVARHFPHWHKVGTLFAPAEDNSVFSKQVFTAQMQAQGISVVALPVNSASEINDAALALASQQIDAIIQIPDNQSASGFMAIAQAAFRSRVPLLCFAEAGIKQGAALAYTLDYYQAGYDAALKTVAVMRGQSPADIPFNRPSKMHLIVNQENARLQGFSISDALLKQADRHYQ